MCGDRIVLADPTGALKPVIEGLDLVRDRIEAVRYALVGGLAVFARVGAYRVTSDVDAALRTTGIRSRELVADISDPVPGERHSYELENGIVFDVLLANPKDDRRAVGSVADASPVRTQRPGRSTRQMSSPWPWSRPRTVGTLASG